MAASLLALLFRNFVDERNAERLLLRVDRDVVGIRRSVGIGNRVGSELRDAVFPAQEQLRRDVGFRAHADEPAARGERRRAETAIGARGGIDHLRAAEIAPRISGVDIGKNSGRDQPAQASTGRPRFVFADLTGQERCLVLDRAADMSEVGVAENARDEMFVDLAVISQTKGSEAAAAALRLRGAKDASSARRADRVRIGRPASITSADSAVNSSPTAFKLVALRKCAAGCKRQQ